MKKQGNLDVLKDSYLGCHTQATQFQSGCHSQATRSQSGRQTQATRFHCCCQALTVGVTIRLYCYCHSQATRSHCQAVLVRLLLSTVRLSQLGYPASLSLSGFTVAVTVNHHCQATLMNIIQRFKDIIVVESGNFLVIKQRKSFLTKFFFYLFYYNQAHVEYPVSDCNK